MMIVRRNVQLHTIQLTGGGMEVVLGFKAPGKHEQMYHVRMLIGEAEGWKIGDTAVMTFSRDEFGADVDILTRPEEPIRMYDSRLYQEVDGKIEPRPMHDEG